MRAPRLLMLVVLLAVTTLVLWPEAGPKPDTTTKAPARAPGSAAAALPEWLPAEAAVTLWAIERGGPFPYRQDGAVFGNRERLLPARARGYYREYTVPTPGLEHRGPRRIVTGGSPPAAWYYTGDHYKSFRRFEVPH
ncbi:MAG: ribonuclease domain-containing protein [Chloroflexota bacterium]